MQRDRTNNATSAPLEAVGRQVVAFALRAPSVHNTQPWAWRVRGSRLDLHADRSRQLTVADPAGRNLTISCGAALQYAVTGAAAIGWPADVQLLPTPGSPDHMATLRLDNRPPTRRALADAELLRGRKTDRRRFIGWPMSAALLQRLVESATEDSATAMVVTSVPDRLRIELLLGEAMSVERADARFVEEQNRWLAQHADDGVPTANAHPWTSPPQPAWPSRFDAGVGDLDSRITTRPTDGLLVITTVQDDPTAWLRTGRFLCRLWTAAMDRGLSLVPLSQVVEVDETRNALRHEVLGGDHHAQLLLRVGWQEIARNPLPMTPRRSVDDVLLG